MNKTLKIILLVGAMMSDSAHGQDLTGLHLAQCLRAETDAYSGHNDSEWAAMSWVIMKRSYSMGVSFDTAILRYCAVFDKRSRHYGQKRSRAIRASTFEDPMHGTVKDWVKLRVFVDKFSKGLVSDPCSVAEHFGCASDVKPNTSLVEVCPWLGKRGNKYYRVKR